MLNKILILFTISIGVLTADTARLSPNTIPESYDLNLNVDIANLEFNGSVIITLKSIKTTSFIELHQKDLKIDFTSLTDIRNGNQLALKNTEDDDDSEIWKIILKENLIKDQFYELRLQFSGDIRGDEVGLYRSTYYRQSRMTYAFLLLKL